MKKKMVAVLMTAMMAALSFSGCGATSAGGAGSASGEEFPAKDLNGIVMWGEGGGTDNIVRPLCTAADELIDKSIIVQNKTGGTGAIATQYVYDQASDGYTLLLGAENPALYQILGTSELTYDDFTTVLLIGSEDVSLVVPADSEINSVQDLVDAAKAEPGKLMFAATGEGGCQWQACGLITAVTGAEFTQLPLDGDADCLSAVMGGNADVTTIKSSQVMEAYKAGSVKVLATLTAEPVAELEGVKPITDEFPDFGKYLPFGPFYGVWVKKDTPADVVESLSKIFEDAYNTEEFQKVLKNLNVKGIGTKGEEADKYIADWTKNTASALFSAGLIEKSPSELGLE